MSAESAYDQSFDLKNRITYRKVWLRPPGLNADILSATEAVNAIVDTEFELLGTNAASTCATISTTGGCIILPHLDASQSAWATTVWDTSKKPSIETTIETDSSVADMTIWFGFKLTNTPVIATDNDQVFFRYQDTQNSGRWSFEYSVAGTDYSYAVPTSVVAAVAASTRYRLRIEIDGNRRPMGFINDRPIFGGQFNALTSLTTLKPYTGVLTGTTSAKIITSKYIEIGRDL
jgi:hypothetical protein